jgi:hypothetical protein
MTPSTAANDQGSGPVLDMVDFARLWSKGGNLTLVAIYPGKELPTVAYDHAEADVGARDFAEVHQENKANIYFTANQTHGRIEKKPAMSAWLPHGLFGLISTPGKWKNVNPTAGTRNARGFSPKQPNSPAILTFLQP